MEEALELIYRGQCNVAVKAKEIGVSTEELKRLFRVYAMQRPIDEDILARRRGTRLALGLNTPP